MELEGGETAGRPMARCHAEADLSRPFHLISSVATSSTGDYIDQDRIKPIRLECVASRLAFSSR